MFTNNTRRRIRISVSNIKTRPIYNLSHSRFRVIKSILSTEAKNIALAQKEGNSSSSSSSSTLIIVHNGIKQKKSVRMINGNGDEHFSKGKVNDITMLL